MFEEMKREEEEIERKKNKKFISEDIENDEDRDWAEKFMKIVNKENEKIEKKYAKKK